MSCSESTETESRPALCEATKNDKYKHIIASCPGTSMTCNQLVNSNIVNPNRIVSSDNLLLEVSGGGQPTAQT